MANALRIELGADVRCTDGVYGSLRRIVVDLNRSSVTHLVVEPRHRAGLGRLVPIALTESAERTVSLSCSRDAVEEHCPLAEEVIVPRAGDEHLEAEQLTTLPFYGLDPGSGDLVSELGGNSDSPWVRDDIPEGEVEVAPHEHVTATDGTVGRMRGVLTDGDHRLTHVLLSEGHLWGKRDIAIPMALVEALDAGVRLSVSSKEVEALPTLATG